MDIEAVRTAIKSKLGGTVNPGDKLTYYAVVLKAYTVTYLGDADTVLGSDEIKYVASEGTPSKSYTVEMTYIPDDSHNFEGWKVRTGTVTPTQDVYPNGTAVTISGDVVFAVEAPKGNWLVFDENGRGAKYNAPQFVKTDQVTKKPCEDSQMTRYGYTFGGWYKDAACSEGQEFTFGGNITERTVIYAKWTPAATAKYSVIIWRQGVDGETYDFEEVINLNGTVGTNVSTVTESGTGDGKYASIDGTAYRWTGFHLDRFDQNVEIVPEGTAVVNVYYNRNTISLVFHTYSNRRWNVYQTLTGLYGSTLADNNLTWPNNYDWYANGGNNGSTSGTRTTFMDAFLPSDGASTVNFYGSTPSGNATIIFYKQNPEKTGYVEANRVTASGATWQSTPSFYITDKYNGFQAYTYRVDGTGNWNSVGNKQASTGYYNNGVGVQYSTQLEIRYNRLEYPLTFLNGVYVKGDRPEDQQDVEVSNHAPLKDAVDVTFGASLASYNVDGDDYYIPNTPDGYDNYVFAGWYADEECTTPYTFSTMTEGGINVYAKWIIKQYRVFLHPNAGTDPTLDWGSDTQAMNFRITSGGKVSIPTGLRNGYELVGWYSDPEFKNLFNDAFVLNDTTVTATYDKTKDFTDPWDKWGNDNATTNSDITGYNGGDRFWITKKLDLYARWRATLDGAAGIGIVYDAGEGSNPPTDSKLYTDQAYATAGVASKAPSGYRFDCWVVQTWNGSAYEDLKDSEGNLVTVYPGLTYEVLKTYAKALVTEWVNPNNESDVLAVDDPQPGTTEPDSTHTKIKTATYTMQLRAEYVEVEEGIPTHINWYDNYSDENEGKGKLYREDKDLQINEAVDIYAAPEREGYKFLGWTKTKGGTTADFLKWNGTKYTATIDGTDHDVTKVAADEKEPLEDLYAVWEVNQYEYTIHHYLKGTTTKVKDDETGKADFESTVNATIATTYEGLALTKDSPETTSITIATEGNVLTVYYTIALSIKAETKNKTYDGTPLVGEYTIETALEADAETIKAALGTAPSITNVADSPLEYLTEADQATITGIPGYYVVSYTSGTLTIAPKAVTVTADDKSREYNKDNPELTATVEGVVGSDTVEYTLSTTAVKTSPVGEYPITPSGEATQGNYTVTYVPGTLTITDNTDGLTVTAVNYNGVYDAAAHEGGGTPSIEGATLQYRVKGEDGEFGEWSTTVPSITNVGKVEYEVKASLANYADATASGTLTVTPKAVTVTADDDEKVYDNDPTKPAEYTATVEGTLGTDTVEYTVTRAAGEDAGEYTITPAGEATQGNYTVTYVTGTFTITKRAVTLTSASDKKEYDGKALTNDEVTVSGDGFVDGEGATYDVTGTQTLVGKSDNEFTYKLNDGTKADNYEITTVFGTLEVTDRTEKFPIEVVSKSDKVTYDGKEHTVEGFVNEKLEYEFDGVKFHVGGIKAFGKGTNVGTYPNAITTDSAATPDAQPTVFRRIADFVSSILAVRPAAEIKAASDAKYVVYDEANNDVTDQFDVTLTEGELEIEQAEVTVTITGNKDSKVYNGKEQTVEGYTVKIDNELYTEKDFTFSGEDVAKGTDVDKYPMGLKKDQFKNTNDNFKVTFEVTDGELEITPVTDEVIVTVTEKSDEVKYDGKEHTIEGYETIECENELYDVTKDVKETKTDDWTVTETYVGEFDMGIKPEDFENTSKNFAKVTFKIVDGTLKITDDVDDSDVIVKKHEDKEYKVGDTVKFTITVTNIYAEPKTITVEEIEGVKFTSDNVFKDVEPGKTVTVTAEYVLTEADIYAGTFKNTATAKFSGVDKEYKGEDEVPTEKADPHLTVVKEVTSKPADGKKYAAGEKIEYKITVKNDGNLTIEGIEVSDDLTGDKWTVKSLAPGEEKSFTTSYTVTEKDAAAGKVVNKAAAKGHNKFDDKDTPNDPGTTETPTKSDTPKTGDTDDFRVWGSIMAVSMICMIFLALRMRKGGKHYSN